MYLTFFGFSEKPFSVTPDPSFLFMGPCHRETYASLYYGITERQGFISIVGDAGTGKTTLINAVMERLDPRIKVAYLCFPATNLQSLLRMALVELELAKAEENVSQVEAIYRLNDFAIKQFTEGGTVVFLVDEAQTLSVETLEGLRMLSNLETPKHKLIQLVLAGQPQLDAVLEDERLHQLSQRISIRRVLTPLNEKETRAYMHHRLRVVEYDGPPIFPRQVEKLVWRYSQGIPRKINVLCDNALLMAYASGQRRVSVALFKEVVKDLGWSAAQKAVPPAPEKTDEMPSERTRWQFRYAPFLVPLAIALLVIVLYTQGFFHRNRGMHGAPALTYRATLPQEATGPGPGPAGPPGDIDEGGLSRTPEPKPQSDGQTAQIDLKAEEAVVEPEPPPPEALEVLEAPLEALEEEKPQEPAPSLYDPLRAVRPVVADSPAPYALQLASRKAREDALKTMRLFRAKGLETYPVLKDLGPKGLWWRIYWGHFSTAQEAMQAKEREGLTQALVRRLPYVVHLGSFQSRDAAEKVKAALEAQGFFPYSMKGKGNLLQLFVGAYAQQGEAKEEARNLREAIFKSLSPSVSPDRSHGKGA